MSDELAERIDGTVLTYADLAMIGHQILNAVVVTKMMRHESPEGLIGYAAAPTAADPVGMHIAYDFIAWASGRRDDVPGCDERLSRAVEAFGWQAELLSP